MRVVVDGGRVGCEECRDYEGMNGTRVYPMHSSLMMVRSGGALLWTVPRAPSISRLHAVVSALSARLGLRQAEGGRSEGVPSVARFFTRHVILLPLRSFSTLLLRLTVRTEHWAHGPITTSGIYRHSSTIHTGRDCTRTSACLPRGIHLQTALGNSAYSSDFTIGKSTSRLSLPANTTPFSIGLAGF